VIKPVRQLNFLRAVEQVLRPDVHAATLLESQKSTGNAKKLAAAQKNARILLVEDNQTNQIVAQGLLKRLGYAAETASSGVEALKALESSLYDIVLMDCHMPEMDGFEATEQVRNPSSKVLNHRVPIIALTAMAMQGDRERCVAAGMDDYLTKPLHPDALAMALERWLTQAGEGDRSATQAGPGVEEGIVSEDVQVEEVSIFNEDELLHRVMNDRELALEIVTAFLIDMPVQIAKLNQFLSSGNCSGVMRQAHTIKGASANLAAAALSQAATRVEEVSKAGDLQLAGTLTPQIQLEYDRLSQRIKAWK
jgi:CheY-like chemotaxis protein/HPt (histidine-containing phosphotransfer) domain-containing protein